MTILLERLSNNVASGCCVYQVLPSVSSGNDSLVRKIYVVKLYSFVIGKLSYQRISMPVLLE